MKLSCEQDASFGVRVSAVIATRPNRSGERCLGSDAANWLRIASDDRSAFNSRVLVVI